MLFECFNLLCIYYSKGQPVRIVNNYSTEETILSTKGAHNYCQ